MTTEISTSMIRELRDKTGAGIMDAKRALEQTRQGTPALVAAYLPTLVEEMELPQ